MLEIIRHTSSDAIPQMTIMGSQKTQLSNQKAQIVGAAIPFEIAHPRYPKASGGSKGGEFMEKGSKDYNVAVVTGMAKAVKSGQMPLENARQALKGMGIVAKQPITPVKAPQQNLDTTKANQEQIASQPINLLTKIKNIVESVKNKISDISKKYKNTKANKTEKKASQIDLNSLSAENLKGLHNQYNNELKSAKAKYYETLKKGKANAKTMAELNQAVKLATEKVNAVNKHLLAGKTVDSLPSKSNHKEDFLSVAKKNWENVLSQPNKAKEYLNSLKYDAIEDKKNNFIRTLKSNLNGEVHPASKWLDPKDINPNAPPPTLQQVRDIYAYTGTSTCQSMNYTLRGAVNDPDVEPLAIKMAQRTSDALKTLPDYKGNVYRGTKVPLDLAQNLQVGSTYSDPAFLSTSTDMGVARKFMKKGSDGHSVKMIFQIEGEHQGKDIDPISAFKGGEKEVLFDANSQFKVVKISTHEGYPLVHLQQIKSEQIPLDEVARKSKENIKAREKYISRHLTK
jgi:hypothetical protein